jgi:hypothetical protein
MGPMKLLAQEVKTILQKYEVIASSRAVYEDGELSHYKDEIDDDLDECHREFLTLTDSIIPALKSGKCKYEDLAVALRVKSIYEFAEYISLENENFPMLDGYVETLQDWLWAPLHESLRKVFTLEVVRDITTKSEFDLAWVGYCEALELYSIYVNDIKDVSIAASVITHLQSLNIANPAQSQQMSEILEKVQGIIDNFVPPRSGGFTQRSAGLEDKISMWIHEITTTPQMISLDEIMESKFVNENPNIEPLKAGWLKLDGEIVKVTGNRFWELLDSNIETRFRTDRKFLGKKKIKSLFIPFISYKKSLVMNLMKAIIDH